MDNIAALKPIFITSRIFGSFPYQIKKTENGNVLIESKNDLIFSVMLIILCSSLELHIAVTDQVHATADTWAKIILRINFITYFINLGFGTVPIIIHRKAIGQSLNHINRLWLAQQNKNLLNFNRIFVLFRICYIFLVLMPLANYPKHVGDDTFILNFFFFLSLYRAGTVLDQFVLYVNLLRLAYADINRALQLNFPKREKHKGTLEHLRKLKALEIALKDFTDVISSSYKYNILLQVFESFMAIQLGVCRIFLFPGSGDTWIVFLVWSVFYSTMLHPIPIVCQQCQHQVKINF